MTTKKILAELVILRLSAGNPSFASKLDERDVFAAIDILIPSILDAEIRSKRQAGSMEINGAWFIAFEDVKVQYSKYRRERYITLPARLISLPSDRGLLIYPSQDQSSPYILTNNNSAGVFKNLEAGTVQRICYVEGGRVFFPGLDMRIKSMLVKMIGGTETLSEYDPLPIPAIAEDTLLEKLVMKFKDQVFGKEKKTNDNNNNTI